VNAPAPSAPAKEGIAAFTRMPVPALAPENTVITKKVANRLKRKHLEPVQTKSNRDAGLQNLPVSRMIVDSFAISCLPFLFLSRVSALEAIRLKDYRRKKE
jgi:hypothetical protein